MLVGLLSLSLEVLMFESAFEVIVFDFMEAIHVKLSDEAVDFIMAKEAREDKFFKFIDISNDELPSCGAPVNDLTVLLHLNNFIFTPKI